jgi:hypothetical protein
LLLTQGGQTDLCSIDWDRYWSILSPLHLAYLELERDQYFPHLSSTQIGDYLTNAINIGIKAAQPYIQKDFISFINEILKSGLRIQFVDQHPTNLFIRAQYYNKKQTITIYKNSIAQLNKFFTPTVGKINTIDLIQLHLYHEWFHHLEETTLGRTELQLPKVIIKKRGPFLVKRSLYRLREIAAHSFTQTAMGLTWSPLLLDQYRLHLEQGHSRAQIRESFQTTKNTFYVIMSN